MNKFIAIILIIFFMVSVAPVSAQSDTCTATVIRVPVGGILPITYVPNWNNITVPQRGIQLNQHVTLDAQYHSSDEQIWYRLAGTYTWIQGYSGNGTYVWQLDFNNDYVCLSSLQVLQ